LRRLHIEELHNFCSSLNLSYQGGMRWVRCVARMRDRKIAFEVFVKIPELKKPLGKPRFRSGDSIKMNYNEIGL
jgi:hypothetical protein